ncbi:MAG TPA: SAM-dependent methyltransferase [Bacillus bacterium]|uniref:class I SAM-dependent methyltransferase n=1 Tax=Siminovitchia fordii TaxID=254759 RepID=UPI000364CE7F|nr:class I SAM-dependent methyltransferase [Siminovitchia fordii]HBZ09584.1 SAM-dependent methyltransferase [Bacillus sp. (in: firmicutes)]
MHNKQNSEPDHTAVRVALWRALHVQIDSPPYIFEDEVGLQLADPENGWRQRSDMDPEGTSGFRASIVARARFIEDLITEQLAKGVTQYVILGAGLDTFAQRRPEVASRMRIFEVDQPGTQAWKRQRLNELGFGIPEWLRLVPVDFERGSSWLEQLKTAGFDMSRPAVVASTGVTQYLSKDAIEATLQQVAALAPGSTLAMTFLLPFELTEPEKRTSVDAAEEGARASGTPFISFFRPPEMLAMARKLDFQEVRHVSSTDLSQRYFTGRTDGLSLPRGEEFLIATT